MRHPYDRAFAFASFYISLSAFYCPIPELASLMHFATIISFFHWIHYHQDLLYLDILLSLTNLLWHMYISSTSGASASLIEAKGIAWCSLSIGTFILNKMLWKSREKAMKNYNALLLVPHAFVRYCGFWAVMIADGQDFDLALSFVYWVSVIVLGLPFPNEKLPSCNGWGEYLLLK